MKCSENQVPVVRTYLMQSVSSVGYVFLLGLLCCAMGSKFGVQSSSDPVFCTPTVTGRVAVLCERLISSFVYEVQSLQFRVFVLQCEAFWIFYSSSQVSTSLIIMRLAFAAFVCQPSASSCWVHCVQTDVRSRCTFGPLNCNTL